MAPARPSGTAPRRSRSRVWATAAWRVAVTSRCRWVSATWRSSVIASWAPIWPSSPNNAPPASSSVTPSNAASCGACRAWPRPTTARSRPIRSDRELGAYVAEQPEQCTASFLLRHPEQRGIVRRMQSMAKTHYGEIQANLLDREVLPMHLLRCKLAFFGVSKFDPRSRLWVRNTMFQGAPLLEDIGQPFEDDWFLPLAPTEEKC